MMILHEKNTEERAKAKMERKLQPKFTSDWIIVRRIYKNRMRFPVDVCSSCNSGSHTEYKKYQHGSIHIDLSSMIYLTTVETHYKDIRGKKELSII